MSSERLIKTALIVSDIFAVVLSFLVSFLIRKYIPILPPLAHGLDIYINAWPAVLLWPLVFWREDLYPGYWLSVREELRRVDTGTTLASVLAMALTFVTKTGSQYSRPIIVGGWLISLFLIPIFRFLTRRMLTRAGFSGSRAVVLGGGRTAKFFIEGIRKQNPPALRPVAVFDDDREKHGTNIHGVEIVGSVMQSVAWASERKIRTAVIAMPGVPRAQLIPIIEKQSKVFPRIIVIPDLFGISAADVELHEVSGILALELRKNLLYRRNRVVKRLNDLLLILLGVVFIIPISLLIAIAIIIESGRPVFFKHERIGRGGNPFIAWKYRTMVKNSDDILQQALQDNPELREEWRINRKLKYDPRLTNVGKAIRRLSLDELPQLWNVLRGEMSLVGPRPIVEGEIERYGEKFDIYVQVLPGLTGLWQVSGRSDLTYDERVWLDTHYVRNWSVWLDLVILVRTAWVVIAGVGAY